ncbi:MAG: threonine synthase, partial [Pseudomonadota bacterium]|nr:threonine synthase [Pseudomonadota bacterium]
LRAMRGLSYAEIAARVLLPFVGETFADGELRAMCRDAYAGFDRPAVAPLVQLETGLWSLELFHGPTLAFKDLAMQLLGRMFDRVLRDRQERITIVGATSGDTGSAAIEACRDRAYLDVVILHPHGRTSEVQRRQMTTVSASNIANIAVDGTFDDCQDLVKAMFADAPFRQELRLSAVNSINWARVAAQIPYYVAAAVALGSPDREVAFSVPTGNFGNVLAAWAARRMGVPIARLVVGSNRNDILTRFLADNDMSVRTVEPSLSPSMDIQVSSNFERLLFELLERDPVMTARTMTGFRSAGRMAVADAAWHRARTLFTGFRLDDAGTAAEIRRLFDQGYLADPHTAIGVAAARAHPLDRVPMITAATAHPAKFPDAMEAAIGQRPPLPPRLADLYERPERYTHAQAELGAIEAQVRAFALRNAA